MTPDPTRWAVLGQAISDDRQRQGLTQQALAARVKERGGDVTPRTIVSLEAGTSVPKRSAKPIKLEAVVAALGWRPGWTDRILAGEDPSTVVVHEKPEAPESHEESPRSVLLELAPRVYEFSRIAARLGAPAELRDEFDQLVQQLLDAVPAGQPSRAAYGLAAYRPHAVGEGVPADDAARIAEVLHGNS